MESKELNSKNLVVRQCLNPYYNGRYSWRTEEQVLASKQLIVLILIIMEDTHGEGVL